MVNITEVASRFGKTNQSQCQFQGPLSAYDWNNVVLARFQEANVQMALTFCSSFH